MQRLCGEILQGERSLAGESFFRDLVTESCYRDLLRRSLHRDRDLLQRSSSRDPRIGFAQRVRGVMVYPLIFVSPTVSGRPVGPSI